MTMSRSSAFVWAGVILGTIGGLSCAKMNSHKPRPSTTEPVAQAQVKAAHASTTAPAPIETAAAPTTKPANTIALDLDQAVAVNLPHAKQELTPVWFQTGDGKKGWVTRLPGNRPIATPAYSKTKGLLFVGGGYGSHEFYAIDAKTGTVAWKHICGDDGPTAAVVSDDEEDIIFNTESCEMEVVDARTGKQKWKEWLGDPLMSQPAVAKGKIYMAYPGGHPHGVQMVDAKGRLNDDPVPAPNPGPAKDWGHRLLCSDLKTGKHLWEQDITADVVSAPVVEGDKVFVTCFDGTSFAIDANTGSIFWQKKNAGTSAPLIVQGNLVMTQKFKENGKISEGIKRVDVASGAEKDKTILAAGDAKYLKPGAAGNSAFSKSQEYSLDSSVGFSAQAITAESPAAQSHLNIGSVAVGWSYQGARAAYANGQLLNAQGNALNCVAFADGATAWRCEATGKDVAKDVQLFAPPALGEKNLYVCSASGHLASLRQADGHANFVYALKQPMAFQPTLAEGNVYVGTTDGRIICIQTNDKDADGWYAWGGNGSHNKSR
ncbi:MAG TPA: PQQ-binding-like beta-propeller repeat protein [Tepidisphaeraceae bacterium]